MSGGGKIGFKCRGACHPPLCLSLLAAKHQMKAENFLYKASCCTYSELSFSIGKESGGQNSHFQLFHSALFPVSFASQISFFKPPSFLGLPLPALPALLVSQRDRPFWSAFRPSPVQSPRFPISCFLCGTAPQCQPKSSLFTTTALRPLHSGTGVDMRKTGRRGGGWLGSVVSCLQARKPARGLAQVRGGALARP